MHNVAFQANPSRQGHLASPNLLRAQKAWLKGQSHRKSGQWSAAVRAFGEAAQLQPHDALYALNLSDALFKCARFDEAAAAAGQALRAEPDNPIALTLRSSALYRLNRNDALIELLEARSPESLEPELLAMLGVSQVREGQAQRAVGSFLALVAKNPVDALGHYRLGLAFNDLAMKLEAAECFRTALLLDLGVLEVGVRDLLAFYEREVCDWQGGNTQVRNLLQAILDLPDDGAMELNPFAHVTLLDDPVLQLKAARMTSRHHAAAVTRLPVRKPKRRNKIKIGYVSADFHRHATSFLMAELFERHDRERFEIYAYSHGKNDHSEVRGRIERASDHFLEMRDHTVKGMAESIRADEIDILVDLKGYTQHARQGVFAHRPAPVQVSFLGFPGTTGADYLDYVIGDPYVTPLESAPYFSEKIAQVPLCYQCNDGRRPIPQTPSRASQGLPDDALVLCGFNQPYKISPEVFDVWCRLLHRLPHSVLWLLGWNPQAPDALRAEARARGVDASRLIFAPTVSQAQHLDRIGCADLFIDTWPCNAHTTASDALWAGLPVITYSGNTFASRVAGSLLNAVGVPDTICQSVEAYEAKVMELATDESMRLGIRRRVEKARHTSPLFSGERIARDIEALYERMWERALAGLPPEHLPALRAN